MTVAFFCAYWLVPLKDRVLSHERTTLVGVQTQLKLFALFVTSKILVPFIELSNNTFRFASVGESKKILS